MPVKYIYYVLALVSELNLSRLQNSCTIYPLITLGINVFYAVSAKHRRTCPVKFCKVRPVGQINRTDCPVKKRTNLLVCIGLFTALKVF